MKIRYIVFITDEWDCNILLGCYKTLEEACRDVNEHCLNYYDVKDALDELKEYAVTMDITFDTDIQIDEETFIRVRGFKIDLEEWS